jgi:hypothetical protein
LARNRANGLEQWERGCNSEWNVPIVRHLPPLRRFMRDLPRNVPIGACRQLRPGSDARFEEGARIAPAMRLQRPDPHQQSSNVPGEDT